MGEDLFYSYTGKREHAAMYAHCAPAAGQNIENWAFSLWYDMRLRQRDDGQKETAAVWIGNKQYKPTVEKIAEHEEHLRKMAAERAFLQGGTSEEVQVDAEDHGVSILRPVEVEQAEDVAAADETSDDSHEEEEDRPVTSIMLEDDDALDF